MQRAEHQEKKEIKRCKRMLNEDKKEKKELEDPVRTRGSTETGGRTEQQTEGAAVPKRGRHRDQMALGARCKRGTEEKRQVQKGVKNS